MSPTTTDRRASDRRALRRGQAAADAELAGALRRLRALLIGLGALILAGGAALSVLQHTSFGYGLVWTLDTVTTLGTIPEPHDTAGRVVLVILELLGIGTLFYALATVTEFFVSGQLSGLLAQRRTLRMIDSLKAHYIVCGFGRVGRQVVRDLRAAGAQVAVIDDNPDNRSEALALGIPYLQAPPEQDEVLLAAGIERAAGVIACVDSDAENVFITLTARGLRDDVLIVARASAEDTERKLRHAGADRVISPYKTSGAAMARVALHPQVAAVLELADYRLEEIEVPADCSGAGCTVAQVRGRTVIVALRRADGELIAQPAPDTRVLAGDLLIALGAPDALAELEQAFQPIAVAGA